MPDEPVQLDVLVLGDDLPAALAVLLLQEKSRLRVGQASVPGYAPADRLTWVHPRLFELHASLGSLRKAVDWTGVHGTDFVNARQEQRAPWRAPKPVVLTASTQQIAEAGRVLLGKQKVRQWRPRRLEIVGLSEQGAQLMLDHQIVRARLLILSTPLPPPQQRTLGLEADWSGEVAYRRAWLRLPTGRLGEKGDSSLIETSLNLAEPEVRGWLIPHASHLELAVDCPLRRPQSASMEPLLQRWSQLLREREVLKNGNGKFPSKSIQWTDLPLAGALDREPIGKHTLLIGLAGGFVSAWGGQVYPGVVSTLAAAAVAKKALREPHLQDALQPYRSKWRAGLGEYLRGLEQDLPLLMPLVYGKPSIARRLGEAILLGENLVR